MSSIINHKISVKNRDNFNKIKELLIRNDSEGRPVVDFNILTPQPEDLNISRDPKSTYLDVNPNDLEYYIHDFVPFLDDIINKNPDISQKDFVKEVIKNIPSDMAKKLLQIHSSLDNVFKGFYNDHKYHCVNSCAWRIENWGVDSNASNTIVNEDRMTIEFETPSTRIPGKIIDKLIKYVDLTYKQEDKEACFTSIMRYRNKIITDYVSKYRPFKRVENK